MTERERLEKLITEFTENVSARQLHNADFDGKFADYLLQNGIICLPCKVGDIITALWDVPTTSKHVPYLAEVKEFRQSKRNGEVICTVRVEPIEYRGRIKEYSVSEFGKLLFFSYDEAAKALKERENNA